MPRKKANHRRKVAPKTKATFSFDRRVILIEQGPLRKKAATECQRAMAQLQKAQTEWSGFQQKDQPAYDRWVAATFGSLLTEIREKRAQMSEKSALISEVEMEYVMGFHYSYAEAYEAVRRRKEEPPRRKSAPPPVEEEDVPPAGEGPDRDAREESLDRELFESFLISFMGLDPESLSKAEYDEMFADFKAQIAGAGPRRQKGARGKKNGAKAAPPVEEPKPEQLRIKELYRLLVRRLHPDTMADSDATVSAIWHEVQEAYQHGNVERLEMLVAMTDLQAESVGEHTSLSQMKSVLAELRRSFNALTRSLRAAKKEVSWGFAKRTDYVPVEAQVRRRMESEAASLRLKLTEMEEFIASWTAPRARRARKARKRQAEQEPFWF